MKLIFTLLALTLAATAANAVRPPVQSWKGTLNDRPNNDAPANAFVIVNGTVQAPFDAQPGAPLENLGFLVMQHRAQCEVLPPTFKLVQNDDADDFPVELLDALLELIDWNTVISVALEGGVNITYVDQEFNADFAGMSVALADYFTNPDNFNFDPEDIFGDVLALFKAGNGRFSLEQTLSFVDQSGVETFDDAKLYLALEVGSAASSLTVALLSVAATLVVCVAMLVM